MRAISGTSPGLVVLLLGCLTAAQSVSAQDAAAHLNPGVNPGEVVVLRQVEPAPVNRVEPHQGPILYKADLKDRGNLNDGVNNSIDEQIEDMNGIALSDSQAAAVRSTPAPARRRAHQTPMAEQNHAYRGSSSGKHANDVSGRLMNVLGTDSGTGGTVKGAVSDLKDTLNKAMGSLN